MTTLLMLSGGIDSAAVAHELLNKHEPLHVHHVELENWNGRARREREATERVVAWLRQRHGRNAFTYTESQFAYGDLTYLVPDHVVWGLVAGIIVANPRNGHIKQMAIPRHLDSYRFTGRETRRKMERDRDKSNEYLANLIRPVAGRVPVFVEPLSYLHKAQIIKLMPRDLLELCWWCRVPVNGRPCRSKCYTCKQVFPVLAKLA